VKPLLADTGPLYAMVDRDDGWHDRITAFLETGHRQLIVPITVLPEVCYLLASHLGASVEFVRAMQAGEIKVEFLKRDDLTLAADVMSKYVDAGLGFVDASLVAVAERLKIRELLTTDRRHFSLVRPRHCAHFDLKP
jgi:predicted nucleic acid-binding protein